MPEKEKYDQLTPEELVEFINILIDEVETDKLLWNYNKDAFAGENWTRPYSYLSRIPTITLYENDSNYDDDGDVRTLSLWISGQSLSEILDLKDNNIYDLVNTPVSKLHQALRRQTKRHKEPRTRFNHLEPVREIRSFIKANKGSDTESH